MVNSRLTVTSRKSLLACAGERSRYIVTCTLLAWVPVTFVDVIGTTRTGPPIKAHAEGISIVFGSAGAAVMTVDLPTARLLYVTVGAPVANGTLANIVSNVRTAHNHIVCVNDLPLAIYSQLTGTGSTVLARI